MGIEPILSRYGDEPLITVEDFPIKSKAIYNCGQTIYNDKIVLLISAFYEEPLDGSRTGIHVAKSDDGIHFNINEKPLFTSYKWTKDNGRDYDNWVIDPRVTKIDDTYYIVRPAQIEKTGPAALLFKTKDFETAEFVECIAMPSNRVPCLFPEKIGDYYVRLDRPYNLHEIEDPKYVPDDLSLVGSIWISYSPDLIFWGKHSPLLYPEDVLSANWKIGPTPPIKTKEGWLEVIHCVTKKGDEFCYSIAAILLDLNNPIKIIGMTDDYILTPSRPYEKSGMSNNVVFPCGAIADEKNDIIRIYYGAADNCIGLAMGSLSKLINACKLNPFQKN